MKLSEALKIFKYSDDGNSKAKDMDLDVSTVLLFYVDKDGKRISLKRVGSPIKTIKTLDFIKRQYADELIGRITEEIKELEAKDSTEVQ